MARKPGKPRRRWRRYIAALSVMFLLASAGWYWWDLQNFVPDEAEYPDQGIAVNESHGLVGFVTVRALGGKFAYLEASRGSGGQDARFARNLDAARREGLMVGAVHIFDPCEKADGQSANFVTIVPRDEHFLPPAIALDNTAENCAGQVSDAAVESELMTFINQVEMHVGKPVILKLSPAFEDRYGIAGRIERDLWLVRDRFVPRYAGRPWLLWSANSALMSEASEQPVEWVVVQP